MSFSNQRTHIVLCPQLDFFFRRFDYTSSGGSWTYVDDLPWARSAVAAVAVTREQFDACEQETDVIDIDEREAEEGARIRVQKVRIEDDEDYYESEESSPS